jgi:DNA-binding NarL/FixJ family response regulator
VGKSEDLKHARPRLDLEPPPPPPSALLGHPRVHHLTESFVLVVLPLASSADWMSKLTQSELAVARLAVTGLSNRAMAQLRGASESTVANQLASVYTKLGISGRRELRARVSKETDVHER